MIAIDDLLKTGRRGLRTRPGSLLLGSTGARLWADCLDDRPGFSGALDFVHKLNAPLLFTVEHDAAIGLPPLPSTVEWRPSHLHTVSLFGGLELEERKFITWGDEAVSLQRWHNAGTVPVTLRLVIDSEWVAREGETARGERHINAHNFSLRAVIGTSNPKLWEGLVLQPSETVELVIAAAVGVAESDSWDALAGKLADRLAHDAASQLRMQVTEYQSWFDAVPGFSSSSPVLDRLYAYRWFLLRHNLARPGIKPLDGSFFYEGRSHKMSKAAWNPVGWEFSKLIPLSAPMHLIEARWHHDPHLIDGMFDVLAASQRDDGQFDARTLTRTIHPYANFLGWGTYQHVLAQGLSDEIRAAIPMLKKQVLGEAEFLATGGDSLPIQQRHQLTGKEYQPSYWYFHDYPDDPFDQSTYTPLKRVDRAIYHYRNARGVAALCAMAGDADAARFDQLADAVAADVLTKQWDAETAFFYDLHHQTDEKAMVRNIVGFYPWWAGITGEQHLPGLLAALGPDEFDTPNPLPSVSPQCPVFQPGGSWKGKFLKGRNGCMWDGPTWPYTNSVVIDALGSVSRAQQHRHDGLFSHFFWKYALMHFQQQDGQTPYLVEHYDSMTGEAISDEPDYNHSYLIDIIIRHIAGLCLDEEQTVTIDPADIGLDHFVLEDVRLWGHSLTLHYKRGEGIEVTLDGKPAGRASQGKPLALKMPV